MGSGLSGSLLWLNLSLGEQEVPEACQYKHLGITIERGMALNTVTKEASAKLKHFSMFSKLRVAWGCVYRPYSQARL